jgi:adenine phosphoribosyltransferase
MSYDGRFYRVTIGQCERELPIFQVAPGVKIAIFNMLGDTEIVETAAQMLAQSVPENADVILAPEVKAVPLGHALSVATGLPLVIVRKVRKPYMVNCLETEVVSITTGQPQTLYIDGKDLALIQGKQALLVDDVVSTGSTLKGLRSLIKTGGGQVAGEMAVFTEGESGAWEQITALGNLPIFTD